MPYRVPWQRTCDCRCPLHHRKVRLTYNQPGCRCAITCASQPVTLLTEPWGCALFLDQHDSLWRVDFMHDSWDWAHAAPLTSRDDFYDVHKTGEHLLRFALRAVQIFTR